MKILQVTQHYIPFFGGVEINTHEICRRLVRDGFEVEVVCERENYTVKEEVIDGVKVHRVFGFRLANVKYDIARIAPSMLLSTIKNGADIIHAHAYGFFPSYVSVFSGKPTVITNHSDPTAKVFPFFDLSRRIPPKLCDRIVCTTELERKHMEALGVEPRRITVIPNGVTLPPMNVPADADFGNVILCLARLDIANKGQDILLQAMPQIVREVPDAKLWIVGEGKDLGMLKALASKLHLNGSVEFKGRISHAAKFLFLKNSRLLCLPPRTESFGVVYLEAMAYGLPIVATKVGGVPEVVDDAGILVPPENSAALAEAVIKVLTDKPLSDDLSRRGSSRVKRFDWELLIKRYEKVYESMV